jgi:hypothetical protein
MAYQSAPKSLAIPTEVVALLEALHLRNPSHHGLHHLSDDQWQRLLRFSDLAHLTLPLASRNHSDGLPEWVSQRLTKNLADNVERFQRVKSTYLEAANALDQFGIPHIVLKGFTLAPDYARFPSQRQQSDLDFYCPLDTIPQAQLALGSIGYEPEKTVNYSRADHGPTLLRLGTWSWRGNAFDPEMPLSIELHFCLWNEKVSFLTLPEIDGFWGRREYRWIEGMNVPVLSQVDQLGFFSMHILRNLLARDSIVHHAYELANFLDSRRQDQAFWSNWVMTHSQHLRSREVIAFDLARQWFGCSLPDVVERQLQELPETQRAWLDHLGKSPIEGSFIENRDVVWLHWSLLDRDEDKLKLIRKTFVPNQLPNPDHPFVVLSEKKIISSTSNRFQRLLSYTTRRTLSYSASHLRSLYRGARWLAHRQLSS